MTIRKITSKDRINKRKAILLSRIYDGVNYLMAEDISEKQFRESVTKLVDDAFDKVVLFDDGKND